MKMKGENKNKTYDLEKRTTEFSIAVRQFVYKLTKTTANIEDTKQLVRSSGSVGANYIEANESISKKDFIHRIKLCRKEAKESLYWLRLLYITTPELEKERERLSQESLELARIFSTIMWNAQSAAVPKKT